MFKINCSFQSFFILLIKSFIVLIYHTGLPRKDETVNTIPRLDYNLCLVYNLFMAYSRMRQKRYKFTVAGNHKYKETEIINSVQLSLTSDPLMGLTVV